MVRIALISDIHYGFLSRTAELSVPGEPIQDENSGGEPYIESTIATLEEENVQYICIAGDLTSVGSPQEFSYCEKMILNLAEQLSIPKENIIIGMGNHDIDWSISELYTKYDMSNPNFPKDLVREKYQKIAASAPLINLKAISAPITNGPAPYSGVIENDSFIMFVLNTGWCCTQDQAISHGKLDDEQLRWFEEIAGNYRDSDKWKIALLHHHPFNYSYPTSSHDVSTLEEGSRFLDIAGENGFHLVMHGHRHHPRAKTQNSSDWIHPITFICAGSFAVNSKHRLGGDIPNTLHIVELTDEIGVLKLKTFQYSPAEGWIPLVRNDPNTPIDSTMLLGKLFDAEVIDKAIESLPEETELRWCNIAECLKYQRYDELNNKIYTHFNGTHCVIGKFPESVYLLKK